MMRDQSVTENIGLFNGVTENRPLKIDLRQGVNNLKKDPPAKHASHVNNQMMNLGSHFH